MPPGAVSSELSLLAQQLDELSGSISSSHKRGRRAAGDVIVSTGEEQNEEEEAGMAAAPPPPLAGVRLATRRRQSKRTSCVGGAVHRNRRSSSRRTSSSISSSSLTGAGRNASYSRVSSSSEQPKWTATSVLRLFSSSGSRGKKWASSTAEGEEEASENGRSTGALVATAADLRLVRQAAAAERRLPAAAASPPLSPCLAPYYSPVLHPFWIAQEKTFEPLAVQDEEEGADEIEPKEARYLSSLSDIIPSVRDLIGVEDDTNHAAGALLPATRLCGRSSSSRRRGRKLMSSTDRVAERRRRRRCKSQRELLQQELPTQSPEAAAAAAAALLSCNSFNSYRIASVVPPAPGRGTWSDETNLGELLPVLLPEQYESLRQQQQELQQMLLPLQQVQHAKSQTPTHGVMQQQQQVSLLPQEIYDLSALPTTAAEPKAAGSENEKRPLQLPLTTEQLVALLQGKSTNAPGVGGRTLHTNTRSSSSMPVDLTFQRSEEDAVTGGPASAGVCDRWMESTSGILSSAFVSASFAAAAATAEAEAGRVAAQPFSGTLQQQQVKVRFEQQQHLDEEADLEQLPTAVSSAQLLPAAAAGTGERGRFPASAFAHAGYVPAASGDAAKERSESEKSEEFPFTLRTPVAASLAAEAAAADAAAAAKREAASLSAACDAVGRIKLQQVWGAAAAEQQQMRLLEDLQHTKKEQTLLEAEMRAIDGFQHELDTWQADLTQQQQQQLIRQQQMADVTLEKLQPVKEQQDPIVVQRRGSQQQQDHMELPRQKADISLACSGEPYFAETRKLSTPERENLYPQIGDMSKEQLQEKHRMILLQHDDTVSRRIASPCTAVAGADAALVASDTFSPVVAAAGTGPPAATTIIRDQARSADVLSTAVGGISHHNAAAAAAARTAAPAFTAASSPVAASAPVAVASDKQQRSLSRPPPAHADTEGILNAATRYRTNGLSAAADDGTGAVSGGLPQVVGEPEASAGPAAADSTVTSTLERSSGPTNTFSVSKQPQLQQKQQQQQKQEQQKELQCHGEFHQGHVEIQQLPLALQHQAGSEEAGDVSLTTAAAKKTAPQVCAAVATANADPAPAHDDAFLRDAPGRSGESDDASIRACYGSLLPTSDAARTAAGFDAAGGRLVAPAAAAALAVSSSFAASGRAAGAALTGPPATASEPANAVARASGSAVAGMGGMPFAHPPSSIKPAVKRQQQHARVEEQQQHQQKSQRSDKQQVPQQQLQHPSLQEQQPHKKEEQQYVLRQRPPQHRLQQQTSKTAVCVSNNNTRPQIPQTVTTTAGMQRGVYARASISTRPSGGGADSSRAATATTTPAVHHYHHPPPPPQATVIRRWRVVNGVLTPVLENLQPTFISAGTSPAAGVAVGTTASLSASVTAARTAPPQTHLVASGATQSTAAAAVAAASAAKPVPVKKFSLFEKLRGLLGGDSNSSCTECVCSSGAASTTGKREENEQQMKKGTPLTAVGVMNGSPAAPSLWLPQIQERQAGFVQWQLPHQQRVLQQRQCMQQNNVMPQELNKEKKLHYTTPSTVVPAAGADVACPTMPLSYYPSVLLHPTSTLPTAQDVVEVHVTSCKPQKQSEQERQLHTPFKDAAQESLWLQQQETRRLIPAPSPLHADVSTRGVPIRPAAEVLSKPIDAPVYISVDDTATTGIAAAMQTPPVGQRGSQRESTTHLAAAAASSCPQMFPPPAAFVPTPSTSAAAAYRIPDASTLPTPIAATGVSSAARAASAAPASSRGVNASPYVQPDPEQQQQQQCRWCSVVPPKKSEVSFDSPGIISNDEQQQLSQGVLLSHEGGDTSVQPDWERQQQLAFQQQLQDWRRQQGIYRIPEIGIQQHQQQKTCVLRKVDREAEARPYLRATTALPRRTGAAQKQSDGDYKSTASPMIVPSVAARGSSSSRSLPRLAFNDSEEERQFQGGGKHRRTKTLLREAARHDTQWEDGDAGKKIKSRVPDNWIRFGAESATTEEDTDAAAAIAGQRTTATLDGGVLIRRNHSRQRRGLVDIKKRWLQQHPEHQPAVADLAEFDVDFVEQQQQQQQRQQQQQQQLQVTEDLPQAGSSGHSERVQQLLQQRRLLQQQRQELLKQHRHRSPSELALEPMEGVSPADLSPIYSADILQQQQEVQQRRDTEGNAQQQQPRRQLEQARQQLQRRRRQQKHEQQKLQQQEKQQQQQRLQRQHLQDREDSGAKELQSDTVKENACVYSIASAAEAMESSPHAALGAEHEEERASPTVLRKYEQPVTKEEVTSGRQRRRSGESSGSSRHGTLASRELVILKQQQPQNRMDNTDRSNAPVMVAKWSEEGKSTAATPPAGAVIEAAADARTAVEGQIPPNLDATEDAKAEEAETTSLPTKTASERSKGAEPRNQDHICKAQHDTAAATAAAHIAAIAATKAARAADTAIAVLAAATAGTTLDGHTLQQQQQQQQQQWHLLDRGAGSGNALPRTPSKQLPVRYTRSEKRECEETATPDMERNGYADAALGRIAEAAVDADAAGGAQVQERRGTLRAQSFRSFSAGPATATAAQVESRSPAALIERESSVYGGVGNPKAAAAATAAAAAAAAEAAREAARRAAANIQQVAAVVAEPLQPLQQLFSFCTGGGSNEASTRATVDKREVPAVVSSTVVPAYYCSYKGEAPSSSLQQQPLLLRYWYNIPTQKLPQQEGDKQQEQVRSSYYGSPVVHSVEPPSLFCQGSTAAAAAQEASATNERESRYREADAVSGWRPRSETRARQRKRGITTRALFDYPVHTQQGGLYTAPPHTQPEEVHS